MIYLKCIKDLKFSNGNIKAAKGDLFTATELIAQYFKVLTGVSEGTKDIVIELGEREYFEKVNPKCWI